MYGFDHLPPFQNAISVTEFAHGLSAVNVQTWTQYTVPRGAAFLYVVLVGAGGDGATPTVGAAATGGGGGGSGAITKAIIPTILIPTSIYVRVGFVLSGAGQNTAISIAPNAITSNWILAAASGSSSITGTGGAAGSATELGIFGKGYAVIVSQAGAAGGAGSTTNGAAVSALATLPLTGGGGGGGSSAGTGGNVTGAGPFPTITGGASGANPGIAGMNLRQPFGGVGGSGGGGVNAAGTGLNFGGDGAIGCGGGGGGNAASGTPGAGGKGGPGYCLIVAF